MFKQVKMHDAILKFYQRSQPIAFSNAETLYDDLVLLRDQILMYGDLSEAQTNYLNEFIEKFDITLDTTVKGIFEKWLDDGFLVDFIRDIINEEVVESRDGEARLNVRLNRDKQEVEKLKNLREITYITPYDFGAIGDNIADDTEALRQALWASHTLGVVLFFPSGCKCRVTEPLNYINDTFQELKLNIKGSTPSGAWIYALGEYGGIRLDAKTALFKDARINGSIKNMTIVGKRDVDYHFFESCIISHVFVLGNTISNFSSFAYDSSIAGVSRIELNTFLTIFDFFKHKLTARSITDSFITNNYINGGQEPVDNVCFAFANGNGSTIQGNFIDYYHTIYKPPISQAIQLPTSIGNQYQVFLYLYDFFDIAPSSVFFLSSGDTFNWTRKGSLAHLNKYEERTVVSEDDVTRTVPTYIYAPSRGSNIVIENAKIESNVGNIVYIHTTLTQYGFGQSRATFIGQDRYSKNKITYLDGDKPYYNGGSNPQRMAEPFFIIDVDELPILALGWSKYPNGTRVRYNHQNYRLINKYDPSTSNYVPTWIETDDI